jgi:hypothetical protein
MSSRVGPRKRPLKETYHPQSQPVKSLVFHGLIEADLETHTSTPEKHPKAKNGFLVKGIGKGCSYRLTTMSSGVFSFPSGPSDLKEK